MTQKSVVYEKVDLIPWDPTDEQHVQRMKDQRVGCGWDTEQVDSWREKMLAGKKHMYWIILKDDLPGRDDMIKAHLAEWPAEQGELVDTANSVNKAPRTPTKVKFQPIGHVAVEYFPDWNEKFELPDSTLWIKSLYVSWALHDRGLGRSAMASVEKASRLPPVNATVIAIDTVGGDFQDSDLGSQLIYEDRGRTRPAEIRTNEEWYRRQDYELFAREENALKWKSLANGEIIYGPLIYMKKPLI